MKKTIYLHIGTPKTASSTIQFSLINNSELLEKAGWLYPMNKSRYSVSHSNIFWQLTNLPDLHAKFSKKYGDIFYILRRIRRYKQNNIILSTEHLTLLTRAEIAKLGEYLSPFDVKIIVYLRRQDQAIYSGWLQNIKSLIYNIPFEEHISNILTLPEDDREDIYYFNYAELINRWAAVFGKDNIRVQVFEKEQIGKHVFHNFLNHCDVPNPEIYEVSTDINVSPGAKSIFMMRNLFDHMNPTDCHSLYVHWVSTFMLDFCEMQGWNKEKANLISPETYKQLSDFFAESNKQVAQTYFNRDKLFFEEYTKKDIDRISYNDFDPQDFVKAMGYVYNNLDKRLKKKNIDLSKVLFRLQ